ncbi:MAG: FkbM family methyltransferase [Actinomycetota bacterium]|nr:FkbM family methyltransferase [Actinomycetota bacterium]
MRKALKSLAIWPLAVAGWYAGLLSRWWPGVGIWWGDRAYQRARARTSAVVHPGPGGPVEMTFFVPNEVCRYRAETFSTKEPETLEWIDRYGGTGAFFDIGANVGLYSVYYAKTQPGPVYAFEPSVLNLGLLAQNASASGVADRVVLVPTPLTSTNQVADFHLTMLDEGGAMSTFGAEPGHDGGEVRSSMEYRTAGVTLDFLVDSGVVPQRPAMVKIDVDGIEHLILAGAERTLADPTLRTVLIEVNDDFEVQAREVDRLMSQAGFVLAERRQADMVATSAFASTFNQIWVRADSTGQR